jgi:hypothetical protein
VQTLEPRVVVVVESWPAELLLPVPNNGGWFSGVAGSRAAGLRRPG